MEPHAEPVPDKSASNFCEFYSPNKRSGAAAPAAGAGADPFDALFKK
jgi:hypothetical protein